MADQAPWAVVPVKPFRCAKRRLSPVLDATERAQLAHLMLQDVLGALVACKEILAGIIVVTRDPQAVATARAHGALTLSDAAPGGINAALALGVQYLAGAPNAGVIVVPSDIPHLPPCAIEQVAARLSAPRAAALIPATADGGTNLLACRPVDAIAPAFGSDSFHRHCQAARRAGIVPHIVVRADVGRDIDRPDDLAAFMSIGAATRTHAFLLELGVAERLQRWSRTTRSQSDAFSSSMLQGELKG